MQHLVPFIAGGGFDDEPVLVADVIDGFLEVVEVDPDWAENYYGMKSR